MNTPKLIYVVRTDDLFAALKRCAREIPSASLDAMCGYTQAIADAEREIHRLEFVVAVAPSVDAALDEAKVATS